MITPEMRIRHRENARENVVEKIKSGHAFEFPYTYFKDVLSACGLPLEAMRWINSNDHRLPALIKQKRTAIRERWLEYKVSRYTIPMGAYSKGDEEELRNFISGFTKKVTEYDSTWSRKWRGHRYWYTAPGDHIVNKDITEPGTNGAYLDGATSFRFDEDFFTFVVLPYRYREIPTEVVMTILFPDVPLDKYEFIPDSDSAELETYMRHNWLRSEAIKMLWGRHPKGFSDDYNVVIDENENITVTLLRDNMVVATETTTGEIVSEYSKVRRG